MAFKPNEITRIQTMSDDMAKSIGDRESTSNEAAIVYSKIARICTRALAEDAALAAKKTTRATSVTRLQEARKARQKKPGATPTPMPTPTPQPTKARAAQ